VIEDDMAQIFFLNFRFPFP